MSSSNGNICYSGGAKPRPGFESADLIFGKYAERAGHQVIHYSFKGHRHGLTSYVSLSEEQLLEADPYLKEANKILRRTFPSNSDHTNNLLRRNYHQIKNADRVYAISEFDEKGLVKGGTAWAVYMAILRQTTSPYLPDVYVYDQNKAMWYLWLYSKWQSVGYPVKPEGKYTGIGTRAMNESGVKAIKGLYGFK